MTLRKTALQAIDHFGVQHQKNKAIEELGELIVELSREQDGRTSRWTICGEIADVIIMAEQLRIIYGGRRVDDWIEYKLRRLDALIRGEEFDDGGPEINVQE